MDLSFMSTIQEAEEAQKAEEAKAAEEAQNAASEHAHAPGALASHMPREKVFDDREQRIVQGRMWLISFTDLFSLMLCFFLMLYSMKDPDLDKVSKLLGKSAGGLHASASTAQAGNYEAASINRVAYGDALNLDYLQGVLKNALAQAKVDKDVRVAPAKTYLKLLVDADKVFSGNGLNPDGLRIAHALAERLMTLSNRITVVAIPSDSGNWGDSLAQASAFAEAMRDGGYRKSFIVVGEAEGGSPGIEIRVEADNGQMR
jgi:chemotaxis protein MotB